MIHYIRYIKRGVYLSLTVLGFVLVVGCDVASPPPPPETRVVVRLPSTVMSPAEAARRGDLEQLFLHVREGVDLAERDASGRTLLHVAAESGRLTVVAWLLEAKVPVDAPDAQGRTAAELAHARGHDTLLKILQAHGATFTLEEEVGEMVPEEPAPLIEVEEPEPPPKPELPEGWEDMDFRIWTGASGQTVEAAFLELRGDFVSLGAADGRISRFHINQLSWTDQILARELGRPASAVGSRTDSAEVHSSVTAGFGAGCEHLLVRAIQRARQEVLVAIYTFTRPQIADALAAATQRGVNVQVKYDAKQLSLGSMGEVIQLMESRGVVMIPITMSGGFASMHHKFAIIDSRSVFTGSFNFTNMAVTESYENCVLIESVRTARDFKREYDRIRSR